MNTISERKMSSSPEICLVCSSENTESLSCGHLICRSCLVEYLQIKINELHDVISCPAHGCREKLQDVEMFLNDQYQERLKRNINIERVANNSSYLKLCPKCEFLCERNDVDEISIQCGGCDHRFCFECGHKYRNENHVCERVKIDSIIDRDNGDMKLCPKCNIIIEREEGCDAVKCIYCGFRFCWNCLRLVEDIADEPYHKLLCTGFIEFAVGEDYDSSGYESDHDSDK